MWGGEKKNRLPGPTPSVSDSVGLGWAQELVFVVVVVFNKFQNDSNGSWDHTLRNTELNKIYMTNKRK